MCKLQDPRLTKGQNSVPSADGLNPAIYGHRKTGHFWRPGGPRTLTPLDPNREPNRQTFWFGAELAPDDNEVWFRITLEAVHRMEEKTPGARGNRLVDALLAWFSDDPDHLLADLNRFQVYVSDAGDTRIEPYGD